MPMCDVALELRYHTDSKLLAVLAVHGGWCVTGVLAPPIWCAGVLVSAIVQSLVGVEELVLATCGGVELRFPFTNLGFWWYLVVSRVVVPRAMPLSPLDWR